MPLHLFTPALFALSEGLLTQSLVGPLRYHIEFYSDRFSHHRRSNIQASAFTDEHEDVNEDEEDEVGTPVKLEALGFKEWDIEYLQGRVYFDSFFSIILYYIY